MKLIDAMYPQESNEKRLAIYDYLVSKFTTLKEPSEEQEQTVTMCQAVSDKQYRLATWFCLILAFFNQFSGINIVNEYSNSIFESLNSQQEKQINVSLANTMVAQSGLIGC